MGIRGELREESGCGCVKAFQGPESRQAAIEIGSPVGRDGGQLRGKSGGAAVGDLEPGESRNERIGVPQLGQQRVVGQSREVRRRDSRLVTVSHAPDAAAGLVAVRMRAGYLVMRDDLVVPIDDVEGAVGSERHRDRSEPAVVGGKEVGRLRVAVTRPVGRGGHELDRVGDRVGEVEDAGPGRGGAGGRAEKAVGVLRQREAAQAGAAHLGGRERRWHERLVGAEQVLGTGAHPDPGGVGNDRISLVVGLLEEGLPLAAGDESPDVVRPRGEVLERRAVGPETPELALDEGHLGRAVGERRAVWAAHLRGVEESLRHEDPAARLAQELVGKQVRVLRAEAREHHFVAVGPTVAVGVAVKADVGAVLDQRSVAEGLHAERHHEAVREDPRRSRRRRVRFIEDEHPVTAAAGEERVGLRLVLVGVDRVFERGHRPEAHPGVPRETDELARARGFGGDELHFEAPRYAKRGPLLLGGKRFRGDGVVADVAAGLRRGRRGLGGRGGGCGGRDGG